MLTSLPSHPSSLGQARRIVETLCFTYIKTQRRNKRFSLLKAVDTVSCFNACSSCSHLDQILISQNNEKANFQQHKAINRIKRSIGWKCFQVFRRSTPSSAGEAMQICFSRFSSNEHTVRHIGCNISAARKLILMYFNRNGRLVLWHIVEESTSARDFYWSVCNFKSKSKFKFERDRKALWFLSGFSALSYSWSLHAHSSFLRRSTWRTRASLFVLTELQCWLSLPKI